LQSHTLITCFIDAHGHVFNTGVQVLWANLLPQPNNKKLGIIMGFGYDDSPLRNPISPSEYPGNMVGKYACLRFAFAIAQALAM
jgi:hypothetical protein